MIRAALESDYAAILDLTRQLGYDIDPKVVAQNLRMVLDDPAHEMLAWEAEGEVVGMISILEQFSITEPRYALVTAVVVDERHRGQGIGQELLTAAQDWCRERGLLRMRLRANVIRAEAHRLYERFGFVAKKDQRVFDLAIDKS